MDGQHDDGGCEWCGQQPEILVFRHGLWLCDWCELEEPWKLAPGELAAMVRDFQENRSREAGEEQSLPSFEPPGPAPCKLTGVVELSIRGVRVPTMGQPVVHHGRRNGKTLLAAKAVTLEREFRQLILTEFPRNRASAVIAPEEAASDASQQGHAAAFHIDLGSAPDVSVRVEFFPMNMPEEGIKMLDWQEDLLRKLIGLDDPL